MKERPNGSGASQGRVGATAPKCGPRRKPLQRLSGANNGRSWWGGENVLQNGMQHLNGPVSYYENNTGGSRRGGPTRKAGFLSRRGSQEHRSGGSHSLWLLHAYRPLAPSSISSRDPRAGRWRQGSSRGTWMLLRTPAIGTSIATRSHPELVPSVFGATNCHGQRMNGTYSLCAHCSRHCAALSRSPGTKSVW